VTARDRRHTSRERLRGARENEVSQPPQRRDRACWRPSPLGEDEPAADAVQHNVPDRDRERERPTTARPGRPDGTTRDRTRAPIERGPATGMRSMGSNDRVLDPVEANQRSEPGARLSERRSQRRRNTPPPRQHGGCFAQRALEDGAERVRGNASRGCEVPHDATARARVGLRTARDAWVAE